MNSMTGYGRATAALGEHTLTVQVNSVNRKSLDLALSLPDEWQPYEPACGEAVRRVAQRGKVHVAVEVTGKNTTGPGWDESAVTASLQQLEKLALANGVKFAPTTELLWQMANAQRTSSKLPVDDDTADVLLATLGTALRGFAAMRAKEGETLLVDFLGRLEKIRAQVEAITLRAPQVISTYREQLMQRLRAAGLELDVNDERVLKEVALFADRCDIAEEITRLHSHLGQLTTLLRGKDEVGRKGEFILQEIGREIHTIGSKANDLQISQRVIELKNELERVKEQIANVE
jgi:uncharacterized protein (TIGR00255 family)